MHGTLEQLDDGRWQVRFTRTLRHPPEKVWRAITEPEHLAHWFPTTIEGERTTGARLRFAFPGDQAPPWHVCPDALTAHLGRGQDTRESMGAWKDVHPDYVESFGAEAATIGPPEGFE